MIGMKKKREFQSVTKDVWNVERALSDVPLEILTGNTPEADSEYPGRTVKISMRKQSANRA
jgi:hypothetical protein